jgi:hypothetical protein
MYVSHDTDTNARPADSDQRPAERFADVAADRLRRAHSNNCPNGLGCAKRFRVAERCADRHRGAVRHAWIHAPNRSIRP